MPPPNQATAAQAKAYADAVAKALEQTGQAVAALQANMMKAGAALVAALGGVPPQAKQATSAIDGMGDAVGRFTRIAGYGFLAAKVGLLGFVRAGLEGTAQTAMLGFHMQMLSRSIASIFLPTIDKVVAKVGELSHWFQKLSGHQQDNAQKWALGGLAALGMASALPKLAAGFQLVTSLIPGLSAAITGLLSSTGIGAFLPLIGAAVAILTGFAVGTEVGRRSVDKLWKAVQPLGDAFARVLDRLSPLIDRLADLGAKLVEVAANQLANQMMLVADATLLVVGALDKAIARIDELGKRFPAIAAAVRSFTFGLADAGKTKPDETKQRGIQPGGQFEDVEALFKRIQSAATSSPETKKPEEETAAQTKRTADLVQQIYEAIGGRLVNTIPGVAPLV